MKTASKMLLLSILLMTSCIGEKNFYQLDDKRMSIDGATEPPEPDENINNSTLEGVDTNNDGIRDDIERMINRMFPSDSVSDYNLRNAYRQFAKAALRINVKDLSKKDAMYGQNKISGATFCILYFYGINKSTKVKDPIERAKNNTDLISSKIYNTKSRLKNKKIADNIFAGQMIVLPKKNKRKDFCSFKIKE